MKKTIFIFLLFWLSLCGFSQNSVNTDKSVIKTSKTDYLMPFEGQEETIVSEELVFYDKGGETGKPGWWNTSMVTFIPANPDEVIEVVFETIDLEQNKGFLKIYNGKVEINSEYDEWNDEYTYSLPVGEVASLTGQLTGQKFISSSTDGKLTVGYTNTSGEGAGWKATVKSIVTESMKLTGCFALQSSITGTNRGTLNQPLITACVTTAGSDNPINIKELIFDLSGTTSISDFNNIRVLTTGNRSVFSSTATVFGSVNSLTSVDERFVVNGTAKLLSGNNYFWLVADINPDALPNNQIDASFFSVVDEKNKEINNDNPSVEGNLTISNTILLQYSPLTYNINQPTNFYDDGGKDGKLSLNFEGSVTFVPTIAGKKIEIEFTKLALFYTSSIGKNDILKIYNGKVVNEANLNAQLLNNVEVQTTPVSVKSTADDGSLTVYVKSTTATAKDGFEAIVREFTPVQMIVKTITGTQSTLGTICAADKQKHVLSVNINTENTSPALTSQKFIFNTAGTTQSSDIIRVTLYSTQAMQDFNIATATKLAEVDVIGETFEIPCNVNLSDGNNYFHITCDIADNAISGNIIDFGCTSVTISGTSYNVENPQPSGNFTIKNEYVSTVGTFEKNIYGTWSFRHTYASSFSEYYKAEYGDQIVTFIPGNSGNVIELEFSKFSIWWSAYSGHADLKVYNGKTVSADNLLWEATSSNYNAGPKKILRSESLDGALTVVFNANSSMSNAPGWLAQVREYTPKNMAVKTVEVFQNNADIIKLGAANQEIIGISVLTEGSYASLLAENISVNMKNSSDLVQSVSIYYTGSSATFSTEKLYGTIEASPTVVVTPENTLSLVEGANYFWIAYNMKSSLESDRIVDAAINSLLISGITVTPVNGDPTGERITKNIYELQQGNNGEVVINGSLMFYDDGGANDKFSAGFNGNVTFAPANEGEVIKLVFEEFSIGTSADNKMSLYNGAVMNEQNLIWSKNGKILPLSCLSSSEDGKLTVHFKSSTQSYNRELGWTVKVISAIPEQLHFVKAESSSVVPQTILGGSKDVAMLKLALEIGGDINDVKVNSLEFDVSATTLLSDIKNAKIYFSGLKDSFIPDVTANNLGECIVETNNIKFDFEQKLTGPGIYYFWLAYDINSNVAADNNLCAKLTSIKIDNSDVSISLSEQATTEIRIGFQGTYLVGVSPAANYNTIESAIAALSQGIDGPVVFEIESGVYTGKYEMPEVEGSSPVNTITFKSQTGNYADVTIRHDKYVNPGNSSDLGKAIFRVKGADFVIIDGLTFTTDDLTFPSIVNIKNMSRNVTIKNCNVKAGFSNGSDYSKSIKLVYMESENLENRNSDYLTLENNLFEGGYIAVDAGGTGFVDLPKERGLKIINNRFVNQGFKSIYVRDELDALISGNIISNNVTDKAGFQAMDLYRLVSGVVCNNNITLSTQKKSNGIEMRPVTNYKVYNNVVNYTTVQDASYAILLTDACTNVEVAHNTVRMASGTGTTSALLEVEDSVKDAVISNNIFYNETPCYIYRMMKADMLNSIVFNNNAVFAINAQNFAYNGSNIADFETWKSIATDNNSIVERADFYSEINSDLMTKGNLASGITLDFVKKDLLGRERSKTNPTIGAYEYQEPINDKPEIAAGYPVISAISYNGADIKVKYSQTGKLYFKTILSTEEIPSPEEVFGNDNGIEIIENQESVVHITGLNENSIYITYFGVLNISGIKSDIISSDEYKTKFSPTIVSTFENIESGLNDFKDGTAQFTGFEVKPVENGIEGSTKVASMISDNATVMITNTETCLLLNGFYLSSDSDITIKTFGLEGEKNKVINSTSNSWIFCNLKDMGEVKKIEFTGNNNTKIDNFSGLPMELQVKVDSIKIHAGQNAVVKPTVTGGVPIYTYIWKDSKNNIVSNEQNLTVSPLQVEKYRFTVTDSWGNTAKATTVVNVESNAEPATFENLVLQPESYWKGDNNEGGNTCFYSGSYSFDNNYDTQYSAWNGFAYSNITSTQYNPDNMLEHQFHCAAGGGVDGSSTYAVAFTMGNDLDENHSVVGIKNSETGDFIKGFYVTNSAYFKYSAVYGDSYAGGPFVKGDWFKLIAVGKDENGTEKSKEFYLADFRSDNSADHYILDTWQWVDLSSLGKVTSVIFKMDGSRKSYGWLASPSYFCMDNFNGTRVKEKGANQIVVEDKNLTVDLSAMFGYSDINATSTFVINENPEEEIATVSIEGKILTISGIKKGDTKVVIEGSYKGTSKLMELEIKTVSAAVNIYTITVAAAEHGTITPSTISVEEGDSKTFTITADAGYKISDVKVDNQSVGAVNTYIFENVTANHTITALFEKIIVKYNVTILVNNENWGTVSGAGEYEEGSEVTITAIANEDFEFDNWNLTGSGIVSTQTEYTFTLDSDKEFTAIFRDPNEVEEISENVISLYPVPAKTVLNIATVFDNYMVSVVSMSGNVLIHTEASYDTKLDISNLNSGIYMIVVNNGKTVITRKFVKTE